MLSLREHIKSEPHIVQNKLLNILLPFFIAFPSLCVPDFTQSARWLQGIMYLLLNINLKSNSGGVFFPFFALFTL